MGFLHNVIIAIFGAQPAAAPATRPEPTCPQCHTKLTVLFHHGSAAARCNACGGLWVDSNALRCLIEESGAEVEGFLSEAHDTLHTYARSTEDRSCAVCFDVLDNYQFDYSSGIWIDACPDGHGLWLDGGELVLVRQHHEHIQSIPAAEIADKVKKARSQALMDTVDGAAEGMRENAEFMKDMQRNYPVY